MNPLTPDLCTSRAFVLRTRVRAHSMHAKRMRGSADFFFFLSLRTKSVAIVIGDSIYRNTCRSCYFRLFPSSFAPLFLLFGFHLSFSLDDSPLHSLSVWFYFYFYWSRATVSCQTRANAFLYYTKLYFGRNYVRTQRGRRSTNETHKHIEERSIAENTLFGIRHTWTLCLEW